MDKGRCTGTNKENKITTVRAYATRIGPIFVQIGENMKIMPNLLKKLHFSVIIKT